MLQGFLREFQLPVACTLYALALVLVVFLPVVEVTDEVDFRGVRCPLAKHPALCQLMQAEVKVTAGKVRQGLLAVTGQLTDFPQGVVVTSPNGTLKGFKP